jgi:hypothetical protein
LADEAHKYLPEVLHLGWGNCHRILVLDLYNLGASFGGSPKVGLANLESMVFQFKEVI